MSRDIFVGRTKELDHITRELVRDPAEKCAYKLFYVEGEEGVGKSEFISQVWEHLVESSESYIWAGLPEITGEEQEYQLLEKIVQSMDSNKQHLIKKIGSFARAFGTASFEYQNKAGSSAVVGDGGSVMEVWLELLKNHFYSETEIENMGLSSIPRLVIVLEDFSRYPRVIRTWLKDVFIKGLEVENLLNHVQFIISTSRPFTVDSESEKFWDQFNYPMHESILKTLSIEEIADYLRKRGTPEISASKIFEKTGGFPGEVVTEVEKQEKQPVTEGIRKEITNLLTGKTSRQKFWLKAAAHLSVCNKESLSLFCAHDEVSKALEWLAHSSGVDFQQIGYGIVMDLDMSKKILRWLKSFENEEFGRLLSIAEKYNDFVDAIPQPNARAMLTDLSVFNYFNGDIIRRVLKKDEKPYMDLVKRAPEYFENGKFNYRLNKDIRRYISEYRELLMDDHYKAYEMQVKKEWDLIKNEAIEKKESLEKDMIANQKELGSIRGEMEKLAGQIEIIRENVISNLDHARKLDIAKSLKGKGAVKFPGLLYQLLGILIVLISVGYPGAYSIFNISAGILLIMYGMFGPLKKAKKVNVDKPLNKTLEMKKEDDSKVESDPNVRMLTFKRNNLEIRFKQLHNAISRFKGQLGDLEKRLEEPYPVIRM